MSDTGDEAAKEAQRLAPWRAAYGAFYGRAPELRQQGSDGVWTLRFRREDDRFDLFRRMVGTLGRFANKPRMLTHLRSLGFDWDEDGVLLTMPTPHGFRERMAALGLSGSGFAPEILALDGLDLPAGAWLSRLFSAVVPINVGTESLYAHELPGGHSRVFARRTAAARWQQSMIHHLLAVPHDTTKHVLALHLVPRSCLLDLGERARAGVGPFRRWLGGDLSLRHPRSLGSVPKGWLAPVPLLTFYENDLVDYCHSVWAAVDVPEDFVATFTRKSHYAQLLDVLSRRLLQAAKVGTPWRDVPPRPYARFEVTRVCRGSV
jgi:hypothetical protein